MLCVLNCCTSRASSGIAAANTPPRERGSDIPRRSRDHERSVARAQERLGEIHRRRSTRRQTKRDPSGSGECGGSQAVRNATKGDCRRKCAKGLGQGPLVIEERAKASASGCAVDQSATSKVLLAGLVWDPSRRRASRPRYEHRHALLVVAIAVAELAPQVSFFETGADDDPSRPKDIEEQTVG